VFGLTGSMRGLGPARALPTGGGRQAPHGVEASGTLAYRGQERTSQPSIPVTSVA